MIEKRKWVVKVRLAVEGGSARPLSLCVRLASFQTKGGD
jgi:hypothetical protein